MKHLLFNQELPALDGRALRADFVLNNAAGRLVISYPIAVIEALAA